ncbi:MAG: type VI secretion system accessory protein TagJ [Proteus mirabilis]|nr:hypothetical protein A0O00_12875 [Proteus mirabilis]HEK0624991.1 protein of avirulence locus ImpE [Proteus mirabilis]HEK0657594.1 protein of avirulence locus ImpE [Proteus mirabilis]HEK2073061.1 protein of avirulence locus ImpE [Proteus mirabilis]
MKSLLSVLENGSLLTALSEAEAQVKAAPIDADKRAYWAQLLLLYGDWDRAQTQLKAWEALTPIARPITQQLLATVEAECYREAVFCGKAKPHFMDQPQQWLSTLAQALTLSGEQAYQQRNDAYSLAEESAGTIIDESSGSHNFIWLADADNRLGPVCELLIENEYYWVPFDKIKSITFQKTMNIVHLVWRHSLVKLHSGQQKVCQIPARYPLTQASEEMHRLGRCTQWSLLDGDGHYAGQGQKSWITEDNEYPLLTLHQVDFLRDEH